jgi:menaquinone-dependent protoporphyrinogen IX oxidase
MKTVVIYKSKTGFTKKYANWIAEALSADIFEVSKISSIVLNSYDTIIYGGSLHAVGINGIKLMTKNIDRLKGKKLVIFATGVSPARTNEINEVINKNFTQEQQRYIKFFYLRGGFDYSKLTPFDKVLMTILKWKINKKKGKDLTPDEIGMLTVYNNPVDFTRKKNINEIIAYVNS